jgi:hypothetical protein
MAWTREQKMVAAMACRSARLSEDQRHMILSGPNFANRAIHNGRATSTSPRLTNEDFESFMALVERFAGGQLLSYSPHYWQDKAGDPDHRLRWRAQRIANSLTLIDDPHEPGRRLLQPDDVGLAGFIRRMFPHAEKLDQLDRRELVSLIEGLTAYARRHQVNLEMEGAA